MSLRRSIAWSAVTREMRNDRVQLPAGAISAMSLVESFARIRQVRLVTAAGAYDRSAIMTLAIRAAKARQESTGEAWSTCMAVALKGAWMAAKHAHYRAMH